jgi:predicted alpha/beta hydrolase
MPKNVTNAWRDWCSNSPYFFHKDYVKKIEWIDIFQNLHFPITVYTATDDDICTPQNVKSFWKHIKSDKDIEFKLLESEKKINKMHSLHRPVLLEHGRNT